MDDDLLQQPPRNKNESIINKKFIIKVILTSAIVLMCTLHIFHHCMDENEITAYTTTMVRYIINFGKTIHSKILIINLIN